MARQTGKGRQRPKLRQARTSPPVMVQQVQRPRQPQATTESDRAAISAALASGTYQIQPGETLYGICLKLYGNGGRLEEICRLNGLEDENKIMAGQNLILPQ